MQYILTEAEYAELKRKADAYDEANRPATGTAAANGFHVEVPTNAKLSDYDWPNWAKYLLPHRFRACQSADEVQAVIDANTTSLEELKKVSMPAYSGLKKLWTGQIYILAGKP